MKNPRFHALIEEIKQLHDMKNSDYATNDDPLSNFKMSTKFGIEPWKGCLVRISDKVSRIFQLAQKKEASVKSESIKDTLKDLATYSLICVLLYEEYEKGCNECAIKDEETCKCCLNST